MADSFPVWSFNRSQLYTWVSPLLMYRLILTDIWLVYTQLNRLSSYGILLVKTMYKGGIDPYRSGLPSSLAIQKEPIRKGQTALTVRFLVSPMIPIQYLSLELAGNFAGKQSLNVGINTHPIMPSVAAFGRIGWFRPEICN